MCKDVQHEQLNILLPASALDVLKDMTGGAFKVFIYLCSCNHGLPFAASIPTVAGATGIKPRSVISALKALRERQLIIRILGRGSQPNQYTIPVPKRQEPTALPAGEATPPKPGLRPPTPAATTPAQPTMPGTTAPPATRSVQVATPVGTPTRAIILELVASCYRPITEQEFLWIKEAYPDEVVLCEMLARFKRNGHSVDADINLVRFLRVFKHYV